MLFVLSAIDRIDAPGLRLAHRPEHRDYLASLGAKIVLAGPLLAADGTTPIGSLVVLDAADRVEAEALVAGDPFSKVGLFSSHSITPFQLVFHNLPAKAS
jgi:uncharacterized protein YciI